MDEKLMDAADVAAYLGIPRSTAYALLHREDCPTIQWGKKMYIKKSDLNFWIEDHTRGHNRKERHYGR